MAGSFHYGPAIIAASKEDVCMYHFDADKQQLNRDLPKQTYFLHLSGMHTAPAVATVFPKVYQYRYLSGLVAGNRLRDTGTRRVGYIAAYRYPEVVRGINAFTRGCREALPDCEVLVMWTGTWHDPYIERSAAEMLWIEYGVRCITQHSDTAEPQLVFANQGPEISDPRMGLLTEELKALQEELREVHGTGIGYNNPHLQDGGSLLTSVVIQWKNLINHFVQRLRNKDGWPLTPDNSTSIAYWAGAENHAGFLSMLSPLVSSQVRQLLEGKLAELERLEDYIFCGPLTRSDGTELPIISLSSNRTNFAHRVLGHDCTQEEVRAAECCLTEKHLTEEMTWLIKGVVEPESTSTLWGTLRGSQYFPPPNPLDCPVGFYVRADRDCVKCPADTTSLHNGSTWCEECPEHQRLVQGVCEVKSSVELAWWILLLCSVGIFMCGGFTVRYLWLVQRLEKVEDSEKMAKMEAGISKKSRAFIDHEIKNKFTAAHMMLDSEMCVLSEEKAKGSPVPAELLGALRLCREEMSEGIKLCYNQNLIHDVCRGTYELRVGPCNLREKLQEECRGVEISVDPELPQLVGIDWNVLRHIVSNAVNNALKHGSPVIRPRLSCNVLKKCSKLAPSGLLSIELWNAVPTTPTVCTDTTATPPSTLLYSLDAGNRIGNIITKHMTEALRGEYSFSYDAVAGAVFKVSLGFIEAASYPQQMHASPKAEQQGCDRGDLVVDTVKPEGDHQVLAHKGSTIVAVPESPRKADSGAPAPPAAATGGCTAPTASLQTMESAIDMELSPPQLPQGLVYAVIDDNALMRKALTHLVFAGLKGAKASIVRGGTKEEILSFQEAVLQMQPPVDICIIDQNLDDPDGVHSRISLGTDIVKQLTMQHFNGLMVIRSANDSKEDFDFYLASGAHMVELELMYSIQVRLSSWN
eukprot:gene14193-16783_t